MRKKRERKNDTLNETKPEKKEKRKRNGGWNKQTFPMKFLSFSCKKILKLNKERTNTQGNYHSKDVTHAQTTKL